LASSLAAGTAGTGVLAYTSDDYAAYNGWSCYCSGDKFNYYNSGTCSVKTNAPTGQIASGQAFFVLVLAWTCCFNNSMRWFGIVANSNADFFKMASTKKTRSTVQMNRIWLDLLMQKELSKKRYLDILVMLPMIMKVLLMENPLMVMILLIL
jgi:hypothetical protein